MGKTMGQFLIAAVVLLWAGFAHGSAQDADTPPRRVFSHGSLEILCITGPSMDEWSPLGAGNTQPALEEIYLTIRSFLVETVFTRREELLYREKHGLYADVRYDLKACEVTCDIHTPYTVKVDGNFIDLLQEMWRQKNVAFMTDLWRMSLEETWVSSHYGPWTLRRLMCLLGCADMDLDAQGDVQNVPFLRCLEDVTQAHRACVAAPSNKALKLALSQAAARLFVWAKRYEDRNVGRVPRVRESRFLMRRSVTFPLSSGLTYFE